MSTEDLKTSILVKRQVPEFIRDEYPKFVTFLEAYYEFLEASSNTSATSNNLITTAKTLRNIRDVDDSIEKFEKNFYNTYASLIPLDVQTNKALLFKHLANLYRSKGNESSYKLLFQLIFGQDIDIIYPKNNVLRPSASNWQIDDILRINFADIYSRYVGDGSTKTFYLAQSVDVREVTVFVDNVLKVNGVDYYINKEYKRLIFYVAPSNNSIIRAKYLNFDVELFNNRKVTGQKSNASAIINSANRRIVSDNFNLGLPAELLLDKKTIKGNFLNAEDISIPIRDELNNVLIDIRASTFSIIKKINVISAGNNYSVGDIAYVFGGNATSNAFGTVATISSAVVDTALIHHGGAAFSISSPISISGNTAFTTMFAVVDAIDTSGANAANSILISPDVISNLAINVGGTVYVNSSNFGSVFAKANISAANSINNALNYVSIQIGPISNVAIITSTVPISQKDSLVFDAAGAIISTNTPFRFTKSLKSIGRYKIINGGSNYQIGDEIVFGPNPLGTYGQHAAAIVANIAPSSGAITRIDSANTRIRGTGSVSTACNEVIGVSTFFTQDLSVGSKIDINTESRTVASIVNDNLLTVGSTFTYTASNRKIGVYDRWPIGGYGYEQNNFPSITVSSATGSSASIEIDSLIGDGEEISGIGFGANGQITSIDVIDPGAGYEYIPFVSVSGGDGTGKANADIESSFITTEGRWTTSDSILSSVERKIQGEDFYVDYSYVISSQVEFNKYKNLLKQLLHPVGLVNYAYYNKRNVIELTDVYVERIRETSISGKINVSNGSALVVGTNTKFNVANTLSIMSIGSSIAVNGESRRIDSIVSNTNLITTSNISNISVINAGSGYSNGYLVFANGGGQVGSLTLTNAGSGYENGTVTFTGTDESIAAVANVEVFAANGALRTLTLVSGGLYAKTPIALPDTNPHRVLYANGITITSRGQGYSNGWLQISGGSPLRDANVRLIVHPNTTINTVQIIDSGLYQTSPTLAVPNTSPNVVISSVSVTSRGNGHSNGVLTLSGGNPARAAIVAVETFPPQSAQVVSITANTNSYSVNGYVTFTSGNMNNIPANARIYVNSTGGIVNITVLDRGLYTETPIATANVGNAVFTLTMLPMDGQIRKITVIDPGLYTSTPTATLNTTPTSISYITSNTAANTYTGRNLANGYLIFSGGVAVRPANATYQVFPANGAINLRSVIITDVGLYRVPPTTATPNVTQVSITQLLINQGGSGYVNGNVIFTTSQATSNTPANCVVTVNATGAIVSSIINNVGLYSNASDIRIVGVLNPATATLQSPTTVANFTVGYNANTANSPNLVITTIANTGQTAVVSVVANSNSYTNATFTLSAVSNVQTTAVISVGFVEENTTANVRVEVYNNSSGLMPAGTVNGAIRSLTFGNTVSGTVATYSLVYTTATAYDGGVLAQNNDVYFVPYFANRGQKVSATGAVSTYSLVYTTTNAYRGGVLARNGDVHFVSYSANRGQKVSATGSVSTYSLVYTTTTAYRGGVLDSNGDVHFVPFSARVGQKISSVGAVSTYSLVYTTANAYAGGVLAQNGDIYFVPNGAVVGQKIDSSGIVSTYSLVYTTTNAYVGGVLAQNGDIYFVPHNANIGQEVSSAGVVSTYSLVYTTGTAYSGGVLAPNGDIHFVPHNANIGQKVSSAGAVSTYSLVYTTSNAYAGGVLDSNQEIRFVPHSAVRGQKISTVTQDLKGKYYYTPDATPNSAGSGAVVSFSPVSWYQTANAQSAIIISTTNMPTIITESGYIDETEEGNVLEIE